MESFDSLLVTLGAWDHQESPDPDPDPSPDPSPTGLSIRIFMTSDLSGTPPEPDPQQAQAYAATEDSSPVASSFALTDTALAESDGADLMNYLDFGADTETGDAEVMPTFTAISLRSLLSSRG